MQPSKVEDPADPGSGCGSAPKRVQEGASASVKDDVTPEVVEGLVAQIERALKLGEMPKDEGVAEFLCVQLRICRRVLQRLATKNSQLEQLLQLSTKSENSELNQEPIPTLQDDSVPDMPLPKATESENEKVNNGSEFSDVPLEEVPPVEPRPEAYLGPMDPSVLPTSDMPPMDLREEDHPGVENFIISGCEKDDCIMCTGRLIGKGSTCFNSSVTDELYMLKDNMDCSAHNVVYLITCTAPGCGRQFIGSSTLKLSDHMKSYLIEIKNETQPRLVCRHFRDIHPIESGHFRAIPIESVPEGGALLLLRERHWILRLLSLVEWGGLNHELRIGDRDGLDYEGARQRYIMEIVMRGIPTCKIKKE